LTIEHELWTVRLGAAAKADFRDIIQWTLDRFGERPAIVYRDTLVAALEALADGPTTMGVKERPDIAKGLFTLHIAREGRRGRHLVLFRVAAKGRPRRIEVLRLLHDAMDLDRYVPDRR
jgi:toxin ParE1/3/4